MQKLTRTDLMSLEQYAINRPQFRQQVLTHKQQRTLAIGPHVTLIFEDRLTIQYQIQEMLRIERIFEPAAITEELESYNPLIPDGSNLKATMLIEYPDVEQRRAALAKLIGIEDQVWLQVAGFSKVQAIADEDMERENQEKTAAVHFLRFEFTPEMRAALKAGAALSAGVNHPEYSAMVDPVPTASREALVRDLD